MFLRSNYGGDNEDNGDLFQKVLYMHCCTQCPQPCSRLLLSHSSARILDTHRQVWVSFLWGLCSFLLGPGVHKVLFVPSKSLFPQSCVSSVIKSTGLQSQILWEFSIPLPNPQVGKSVVGPRTFLTVREFLWYNCSAVCGLSAQWLYDGVNGDLLQEGSRLRC